MPRATISCTGRILIYGILTQRMAGNTINGALLMCVFNVLSYGITSNIGLHENQFQMSRILLRSISDLKINNSAKNSPRVVTWQIVRIINHFIDLIFINNITWLILFSLLHYQLLTDKVKLLNCAFWTLCWRPSNVRYS